MRNWTVICHVSGLVGFVGPLVVWLIKGKDDPQIDTHGKAALNFQISMMIYYAVASVLMLLIIGLFLLPAVGLFDLICIIIGTVKANNGELFNYPLSLKLIK